MNRIVKRQGAKPPWIELLGGMFFGFSDACSWLTNHDRTGDRTYRLPVIPPLVICPQHCPLVDHLAVPKPTIASTAYDRTSTSFAGSEVADEGDGVSYRSHQGPE